MKKAFSASGLLSLFQWLILFFVLSAVIVARFTLLDFLPNGLYWDEASYAYTAWSFLKTGADEWGQGASLFIKSFGEYKPALLSYLQMPFLSAMGLTETAARLPVAILGLISLGAWFFILKALNAFKAVGTQQLFFLVLGVVWLATSPWHFHYSRAAFDPMVSFAFLMSGYALFLQKKHPWQWLGVGLLAVSAYTYNSARLFLPLLLIFHVWIFEPKLVRAWKENVQRIFQLAALALLLGSLLFFTVFSNIGTRAHEVFVLQTPQVANDINEGLYRSITLGIPFERLFANKGITWTQVLAENYISHFDPTFLFFNQHLGPRHGFSKHGNLLLIGLPFFLLGLFSVKKADKNNLFFLLWLLAAPLAAAFSTDIPHSGRALLMLPATIYFITQGGVITFQKIKSAFKKHILSQVFLAFISLLLTYNTSVYLVDLYRYFPEESWVSWQGRSRDVTHYLESLPTENYDRVVVSKVLLESYISYVVYADVDPSVLQNIRQNGEPNTFGTLSLIDDMRPCILLQENSLILSPDNYTSIIRKNQSDENLQPIYIDTLLSFDRFHTQKSFGYAYDTNTLSQAEKNTLELYCQ